MKLNHLALAVRDQQVAMAFYVRYFGFDPSTARRYPDGVIILHDTDGFSLAFGRETGAERPVGFPHFGFDMGSPEEVRVLRARLVADGIELVEDEESASHVGLTCLDPDGHVVEVSWEPRRRRCLPSLADAWGQPALGGPIASAASVSAAAISRAPAVDMS